MDDTCHNAGLPTVWKCVNNGKDHKWAKTNPSPAKWQKCSNCFERIAPCSKSKNSSLWLNNSFKDWWRLASTYPDLLWLLPVSLRTMFFAYEDRKQITRLIIETTDSVSKNLKVNELVAEASQFNHKPDHLLCKSHVVEAFDHYNLDMLATVEN